MSYNSQTPNLGLPQWILSDPPQMSDFNGAFSKIDEFAAPLVQVQKGEISVTDALKLLGLAFGKGDTFNLGNYIAGGYITSGASNFSCYILLPCLILPEVSKVSVSGLVRIRQNGKYILGQDLNVNLSTLDTTYQISTGRYGIAVSIDSGLSNADNNDSAAAFFGNLVVTFS